MVYSRICFAFTVVAALLIAAPAQGAVNFTEDFEGDPGDVGGDITTRGWIGSGAVHVSLINTSLLPASQGAGGAVGTTAHTYKVVGPGILDDLIVFSADVHMATGTTLQPFDPESWVGIGDSSEASTNQKSLLVGVDHIVGWKIRDGSPCCTDTPVGFFGTGNMTVQMSIDTIADTISVDFLAIPGGAPLTTTFVTPLTPAAKANLALVDSVAMQWAKDVATQSLLEVDNISLVSSVIPEPSTLVLVGIAGLMGLRRQRRN